MKFTPSLMLLTLSAALLLPACTQTTDLGFTCEMTKQKADCTGDDCAENIDPKEITDAEKGYPTIDYIAEGVAECDDLVCLRSRNRRYEDTETAAMGYCTAPCQNDDDCTPDYNGDKHTLTCKQLLGENGTATSQAKYCVLPETVTDGAEE
jgi:hypothetical protein